MAPLMAKIAGATAFDRSVRSRVAYSDLNNL
jgi:hypothetical protein